MQQLKFLAVIEIPLFLFIPTTPSFAGETNCLGRPGCQHSELHSSGTILELQALNKGKNCCSGEELGRECRATKIDVGKWTVLINGLPCPLSGHEVHPLINLPSTIDSIVCASTPEYPNEGNYPKECPAIYCVGNHGGDT